MTRLRIACPDCARTAYVLREIFDGLGVQIDWERAADRWVTIAASASDHRLIMRAVGDDWQAALDRWLAVRPADLEALNLLENAPSIDPVIIGDDLLTAAFHVLSGTEEVASDVRDRHERFPASASRLFRAGYDLVPFVDLLAEAIWRAVARFWPELTRDQRRASLNVSHDVDAPYRHAFQTPLRMVRDIVGSIARGAVLDAIATPIRWSQVRAGYLSRDPFDNFDWMMRVLEDRGERATFYVIVGRTGGRIDGDYAADHPIMMKLWEQIVRRGHRIGLHPSYNAFRSASVLRSEYDRLAKILGALAVPHSPLSVRMHYLRFDPLVTPALLAETGFGEDSSLGFADRSGFRRGTCRPFHLWDPAGEKALPLVERPLLAMDATLLSARYEALDEAGGWSRLAQLGGWCHRLGGEMVALSHNNYFEKPWHFAIHKRLIDEWPGVSRAVFS